jgi:hypothetical protein
VGKGPTEKMAPPPGGRRRRGEWGERGNHGGTDRTVICDPRPTGVGPWVAEPGKLSDERVGLGGRPRSGGSPLFLAAKLKARSVPNDRATALRTLRDGRKPRKHCGIAKSFDFQRAATRRAARPAPCAFFTIQRCKSVPQAETASVSATPWDEARRNANPRGRSTPSPGLQGLLKRPGASICRG